MLSLLAHELLLSILCIGETKDEYELGLNEEVCTLQLSKDLAGLSPEAVSKVVIAYEPVWAIGTGLTATPGKLLQSFSLVTGTASLYYAIDCNHT